MAEENKNGASPAAEEQPQDAPVEEKPASEGGEASDAEPEPEPVPQIGTFERLKLFLSDTNQFLARFDDLVEGKDKHKSVYLNTVNELRELLVTLLQRYILHTMVREDFLYKHIVCCGGEEAEAMNTEEFDEHYQEVHKEADKAISPPELAVVAAYTEEVRTYIELGKAMNNDLIFSLKRLLRKSNSVLAGHLG